jgi:hypothetical protein
LLLPQALGGGVIRLLGLPPSPLELRLEVLGPRQVRGEGPAGGMGHLDAALGSGFLLLEHCLPLAILAELSLEALQLPFLRGGSLLRDLGLQRRGRDV